MGALVGGLTQIIAANEQGPADHQASKQQYDREQLQANAAIQGATEKGNFQVEKSEVGTSQLTAEQKSAYADSGVDPTTGTAANVQANTAALGQFDVQQQKINAAREIWGYQQSRTQSKQDFDTRNANIDRTQMMNVLGGMGKWAQGAASLAGGG